MLKGLEAHSQNEGTRSTVLHLKTPKPIYCSFSEASLLNSQVCAAGICYTNAQLLSLFMALSFSKWILASETQTSSVSMNFFPILSKISVHHSALLGKKHSTNSVCKSRQGSGHCALPPVKGHAQKAA